MLLKKIPSSAEPISEYPRAVKVKRSGLHRPQIASILAQVHVITFRVVIFGRQRKSGELSIEKAAVERKREIVAYKEDVMSKIALYIYKLVTQILF